MKVGCLWLLGLSSVVGAAGADEATIAVATNFLGTARALQAQFQSEFGHDIAVTVGSTGQLYAQIVNGAPFDVFLAADQERPRLLAETGLGEGASVFTYAIGRLALWSREPGLVTGTGLESLDEAGIRWFAIADPAVAPYGAAAQQVLERLGLWQALQPRIVRGQNVAQAFAMIETGNAELGLTSYSQALAYGERGEFVPIEQSLHDPIRQDAILLSRASGNEAARDFLMFTRRPAGLAIIERHGYGIPATTD